MLVGYQLMHKCNQLEISNMQKHAFIYIGMIIHIVTWPSACNNSTPFTYLNLKIRNTATKLGIDKFQGKGRHSY